VKMTKRRAGKKKLLNSPVTVRTFLGIHFRRHNV
jgi:hypothetical protein